MKKISGGVTAPAGYKAAGMHVGLKKVKPDLALLVSEKPAAAAAMYTTNLAKAAPLIVTEEHLAKEALQAVVINSATANACTGEQDRDAVQMTALVAEEIGCQRKRLQWPQQGYRSQPSHG